VLRPSNRALSSLDSTLISLGGLIGAGLFVGSGTAMATVGPPIIASYVVAGLLLLALLSLMARVRRSMPEALFITDFVRAGLGALAGSVARSVYWVFWAVVAAIEAMAGANILAPQGGPAGFLAAGGLLLLAVGVGEKVSASLSELEVGSAALKVAVIVAFVVFVWTQLAGTRLPPASWRAGSATAPGMLAGVVTTFFSLVGVEIIHTVATSPTCTAREAARAIRLIAIRVFGVYLVSITLILAVVRSDAIRPGFSPFTLTLETLGHPRAGRWLDVLILVGVLTTLNTALAIGSRLRLERDDTSAARTHRLSPRLLTGAVALAVLCAAAHWPSESYAFLVKSESALLVMVYLLFALAAVRLQAGRAIGADRAGRRMGRALIASFAIILSSMAWVPGSREPLSSALCLVALVTLAKWRPRSRWAAPETGRGERRGGD
jgi:GABA permease